tara:strand:- start:539 stop:685 length:147 start_codon:yes stop_codon:yes gene_type:complete
MCKKGFCGIRPDRVIQAEMNEHIPGTYLDSMTRAQIQQPLPIGISPHI